MEEGLIKPSPFNMYRLYLKGLVSEETTETVLAGFGVAICDQDNNLLFQMKEPIHNSDITVLEAELRGLKRGLTEAISLGINHISIFCDHDQIFELVMGRSVPKEDNIVMLMNDVQCIRQQFTSSNPIMDTINQISFAYKLAKETITSEIIINMPMTCNICFHNDLEAEKMFLVTLCGHQFCLDCVKCHIEVKLLEGSVPRCLQYQCESKLTINSCINLLTPKLKTIWEQKMEEESIPMADRVYCPNEKCSALMSKSTGEDGVMSCCVKCGKPFCINCKVPWHSNLSCNDYKRLGPNPTRNDIKLQILANQKKWRQCEKCKHMIERTEGCIIIVCRCGYKFCYICGAKWNEGGCPHQITNLCACCIFILFLLLLFAIALCPALIYQYHFLG